MAISFGTPQEGLNQFQKALELIQVIKEIASNPKIGDVVLDLKQKIVDTQSITDVKKKEAAAAEESILQSKEMLEDLAKEKAEHTIKVAADLKQIDQHKVQIASEFQNITIEKERLEVLATKAKEAADKTLAEAKEFNDKAEARHAAAQTLEKSTTEREKAHARNVKEFEEMKALNLSQLSTAQNQHKSNVEQLEKDKAAHIIRQQKLEAALKGA